MDPPHPVQVLVHDETTQLSNEINSDEPEGSVLVHDETTQLSNSVWWKQSSPTVLVHDETTQLSNKIMIHNLIRRVLVHDETTQLSNLKLAENWQFGATTTCRYRVPLRILYHNHLDFAGIFVHHNPRNAVYNPAI